MFPVSRRLPCGHGDEYVLNGSKMFITNAGQASWVIVFASTDKEAGHRGPLGLHRPHRHARRRRREAPRQDGPAATDTSALAFQDVKVPGKNRLGEEGQGFKIAMQTLDHTRPGTAAGAVGVARAAFDYSSSTPASGSSSASRSPMNQGVNFLVADMAAEIEAARLLVWQAAWLLDQDKRATLQSSYAKRFAADTAMKVTTDAVQIFGGYGYIKEYPVEKLMRDAKLFQIYEGTSQIQRLVIAREILPAPGLASRGSRARSSLTSGTRTPSGTRSRRCATCPRLPRRRRFTRDQPAAERRDADRARVLLSPSFARRTRSTTSISSAGSEIRTPRSPRFPRDWD
jgi:alkylation response protein AidB-like acyl-CoA dehydrogenase